jgi:hypothetical protein
VHVVPLHTQKGLPGPFWGHVPAVPALQAPAFPPQKQVPWKHMKPEGHAWPHPPQLFASVEVLKQPAGLSQHVSPVLQALPPAQVHSSLLLSLCLQASPGLHVPPPVHWHRLLLVMQVGLCVPVPHTHWLLSEHPQTNSSPKFGKFCWWQLWFSFKLELLHELPQPPQFAGSPVAWTSQPSSAAGAAGWVQLA